MAGIYIHIPFCRQACHYCNFHFSTSIKHKDALIKGILKEIDQRADHWKNHNFQTVYFGGGTPSYIESEDIKQILDKLSGTFKINPDAEITLEGNPDDLTEKKLYAYRKMGINRLSIGIQSFYDEDLKKLNRSHHARQAIESIKNAQKTGFNNITIDLIYGIPGLNDKKWNENIQTALDLNIPHISAYALTVEPQTALSYKISKGIYPQISEEQSARQFEILRKKLLENNFLHYEISNFAKKDFISKHNSGYWQNKAYLGLGPAAHSYVNNTRRWNIANNMLYLKKLDDNTYFEKEILNKNDRYNEIIMTGLRTMWGVNLEHIENLGVKYVKLLKQTTKQYITTKQLKWDGKYLKAQPESLFIIEGIISDLFIV